MKHQHEFAKKSVVWAEIDHHLVSLKLSQARRHFERNLREQFGYEGEGRFEAAVAIPPYIRWASWCADAVLGIYCDVWKKQGNAKSSSFLRAVLNRAIIPEIERCISQAETGIEAFGELLPRVVNIPAKINQLGQEAENLKSVWRDTLEIEAGELELEQARLNGTAPSASAPPLNGSPPNIRSRGKPGLARSRERVDFEARIRRELASVKGLLENKDYSVDELRKEFPSFELWNLLSATEQKKLLDADFEFARYARELTLRNYGLKSPETIKKDRQKLRKTGL